MAEFAGRFFQPLQDARGNAITDADVYVFQVDGVTEAALFADRDRAVVVAQPVSPDGAGHIEFFADPGRYVLRVYTGAELRLELGAVVYPDPADSDATGEVAGHVAAADPHGDRAYADGQLGAHEVDAAAHPHDHDGAYLQLSGGTLTGPLVLPGAPSTDLQAATKAYVDSVAAAGVHDHDADYVNVAGDTMTGELIVPDVKASGLTGAVAASRYVGATTGGAPTTGTFAVGDFVIDQTGKVWVCTAAGTPGTWTDIGNTGSGGDDPTTSRLDETLTYDANGRLDTVTYRDQAGTLVADDDLGYDVDGNLTQVVRRLYAADGVTVEETVTTALTYTAGDLTGVNRTVT